METRSAALSWPSLADPHIAHAFYVAAVLSVRTRLPERIPKFAHAAHQAARRRPGGSVAARGQHTPAPSTADPSRDNPVASPPRTGWSLGAASKMGASLPSR